MMNGFTFVFDNFYSAKVKSDHCVERDKLPVKKKQITYNKKTL